MSESHRLRAVCAALLLSAGFLTPGAQAQFLEPPPLGSPVASATGPVELPPPARLVEARRRRTVARAEAARRIEEVRVALGLERLAGGGHGDVPSAIYATAGGRIESTSAMDAAEKFLAAIGPVLGLTQRDMENLQRSERASFLPGYREIIARRTVGGLPLFGASVRIHVGPRGELAAAVGTLYGHLRMADGPARLTEADAAGRASRAIERITDARGVPAAPVRSSEVAYPLGDVARRAWLVEGVTAVNGIDRFDVVVDSDSGAVLEVISRTRYAQGQVFVGSSGVPQSAQPTATPGVVPPVPDPPSVVSRVTRPLSVTGTALAGNNSTVMAYQSWSGSSGTLYPGFASSINADADGNFYFPLVLGGGEDIRKYPKATGTNLYWLLDWAHDWFYDLGFDEEHGNFQRSNFGRAGEEFDPVIAYTQLGSRGPGSGHALISSNAFMSTSSDGTSPTMGMFVWSPTGSDSSVVYRTDSSLDPDIVLHEFTHGVIDRMCSASLPYTAQSGAIHEGTSDFFALHMQTPASAPPDGAWPMGAYSSQDFLDGIRHYPYSTSLAVNPLTFADLAYVGGDGPEVHADGEIWAGILWEMRAALVSSLGFDPGARRAAQLVLDAIQLLPDESTFVDFRNAILAADQARYSGADHGVLWSAFAKRGLGSLSSAGDSGMTVFVLSDGSTPSEAARVRFWEERFRTGERVRLVLSDANAPSASARVTSSSGDDETVVLSGSGMTGFEGSIDSSVAPAVTGDGVLQVAAGDTIAALVTDADAGGGTPQLTASADVVNGYFITPLPSSMFDPGMASSFLFAGDETTRSIELPFAFPFYGRTFSRVYVNDNGLLSFTRMPPLRLRHLDESPTPFVIAPMSADFDCFAPDAVYYYAGADRVTVRWNCRLYGGSEPVNVAASLFPGGGIRFDYGSGNHLSWVPDPYDLQLGWATVGLVRAGESFVQPAPGHDRAGVLDGAASVMFTPLPPPKAVVTGGGAACPAAPATISADLTGTPPWSLRWSDGFDQTGILTSPATRIASPSADTVYTVTVFSDANGYGAASGSAAVTVMRPGSASISRPGFVCGNSSGTGASVPDAGPGSTYAWTITNGSVTAGAGTRAIVFSAGSAGNVTLSVTVTSGACTYTVDAVIPIQACSGGERQLTFRHLAGGDGGGGYFDGDGAEARFSRPGGVVADPAGNIYVADTGNHTIRRITPEGRVSTLAGLSGVTGWADGFGSEARFNAPAGITIDEAGNLFVADTWNHRIRKVTPEGVVTTAAGQGPVRLLSRPHGLTVDEAGNLFVADTDNHCIRKITPAGEISTLAGAPGNFGSYDGTGTGARFRSPEGIAIGAGGQLFVTDTGNNTVRTVTPAGQVTTIAGWPYGWGSADGSGSSARFTTPRGIAVGPDGGLYVSDYGNHVVRKVTVAGVVTTPLGTSTVSGTSDGVGPQARFFWPRGIAAGPAGRLYVADTFNHTIRGIDAHLAVTTVAGKAAERAHQDGAGPAARFVLPAGIALRPGGGVYVADAGSHTVRMVAADGTVEAFTGEPSVPGSSDGTGSAARFAAPAGLAIDTVENVYVADTDNHTVRKITPAGEVTTLAGLAGSPGTVDAIGAAARFTSPVALAADRFGNVYVAEKSKHAIRRITPAGAVSTFVGSSQFSGASDGTGEDAAFRDPSAMAVDAAGNIYVADRSNHTIRKVTPAGVVTTIAGRALDAGTEDGVGDQARFHYPRAIAVGEDGNLYVGDASERIRRITPGGVVTTVAGRAATGGSTDGNGGLARFDGITGLVVDAQHRIYVTEERNRDVRIGTLAIPDAATIDAAVSMSGVPRQLGTSPANATSWAWRLVRRPPSSGSPAIANAALPDAQFTPDAAGRFEFLLDASGPGGSSTTLVALEAWDPPTAAVSGGGVLCPTGSAKIVATLTGIPPWTLTWSDGLTQEGILTSPVVRVVAPEVDTTYTVTALSDARAAGTFSGSATVTKTAVTKSVTIGAPLYACAGSVGNQASVLDFGPDTSYAWSITNGTITAGAGTRSVTFTAGPGGDVGLSVVVSTSACASASVTIPTQQCGASAPEYVFTHFAGSEGGDGWFDGIGPAARFRTPSMVATDAAGNVYVSDTGNHTIRKITPGGRVSTLAGMAGDVGSVDGAGSSARFNRPQGMAVDGSGNVFVADSGNATIRKITPQGVVSTFAGLAGASGHVDGSGSAARFGTPAGIAVGPGGTLYVSDYTVHVIRRITAAGAVSTFAGAPYTTGYYDGPGSEARFANPSGVATDAAGNVYVADSGNHKIRKITPAGVVDSWAGGVRGFADGTSYGAKFDTPIGIATDPAGNVYVTDRGNDRIRKITPDAVVTSVAGGSGGNADGTGAAASFNWLGGIAVAPSGVFYVADTNNHTIRSIESGWSVATFAGSGPKWGSEDGNGGAARFREPHAVAVAADGSVFVADSWNYAIRKITPSRDVTTFAGGQSGSNDGIGTDATFNDPRGMTFDSAGNLFVVDGRRIRRISPGAEVTAFAGSGTSGTDDGTGAAARFVYPAYITADRSDTLFVSDSNGTIRRITPGAEVTTVAGKAGVSGGDDGVGVAATFNSPDGIAAAGDGGLYVCDFGNHTIRRISPAGVVTTHAGLRGQAGLADGTGSAARFHYPDGIAADLAGNGFISDVFNQSIRRTSPDGNVTTIAHLVGAAARFNVPRGIAVDARGRLYVADSSNHVVVTGVLALPDAPAIDAASAPAGEPRQLGVAPMNATSWEWRLVRVPSGSNWPAISAAGAPNPTFTPDVPGVYVFLLTASNSVSTSVRTLRFEATGPSCTRGDVNGNGTITALDASLILQIVVGSLVPDATQQCAGDLNGNGTVTALDASAVLQCVVGTGPCS